MMTIFYSWQSKTDENFNKDFIEDVLNEIVQDFKKVQKEIFIEKDTLNVPGYPDPFENILKKYQRPQFLSLT